MSTERTVGIRHLTVVPEDVDPSDSAEELTRPDRADEDAAGE